MKIARILIAGVAVTIFNMVVGMVTCGGLFSWVYKVEPVNVWKQMSGPPGVGFLAGTFILSAILALIYAVLQKSLPGKNKFAKGFVFGLFVWAVGILPGMLATYEFMNISNVWIIYMTILGLIENPLKGIIIAFIYGE